MWHCKPNVETVEAIYHQFHAACGNIETKCGNVEAIYHQFHATCGNIETKCGNVEVIFWNSRFFFEK